MNKWSRYGMPIFSMMVIAAVPLTSWPALAECVAIKYRDTPVCLNSFKCTDTPQSSFVREVCFDAAKSYMLIKLNDTWYHYCAVDRASVENLIKAPSVGTYYNQNFRSQGPVHGPFDCQDHPVPTYP
jgi:KTSC domain